MRLQTIDRFPRLGASTGKLVRGETTLTQLAGRRLLRNPLRSLTLLGMGAAGLAIFTNVMVLQPEQHRAPMFVGNPQIHNTPQPTNVALPPIRPGLLAREAEVARRAELTQDLQIELARRGFFTGDPDLSATTRTLQAIRDFQIAAKITVDGQISEATLAAVLTSNIRARDQILSVLHHNMDRLERPETVVAIQRSLTKIGYGPLRDDGHFGPGTKAALEKFEKDRKLLPRGEAPTRLLRELAQASGIAID